VLAREFTVVIERDDEGYLVASVPALHGCHTQARSMDELLERIKEAIQLCIEVQEGAADGSLELIGIQ
jgi:predicted RNase H-like HicB family nuclease